MNISLTCHGSSFPPPNGENNKKGKKMDNFKLGDDLSLCDNILDPVTFDDIVTAVRLNEKVVDKDAVLKTAQELIDIRMRDFKILLENNINEIIKDALFCREGAAS